jgi:cell division protein FtsX
MFYMAKLKLYAIGAVALLAAFLGVYIQGRRDQSQKEDLKDAEDYIETRKRVDGVRIDDAEQWLRNRADKRDL